MAENKKNLTPKQQKAIVALLSNSTIEKAAVDAGISERTLYRWLNDPCFRDECRKSRRQLFSQSMGRIQKLASHAVTQLAMTIANPGVKDSVRVTASRTVLENARLSVELDDMNERLDQLENLLNELKNKNQPIN